MFMKWGDKIYIDDSVAWEYFRDYFFDERLVKKCMARYYEREGEIYRKLIKEFGSLQKAWEEYEYGNRERVEKIFYEYLEQIVEEVEEELYE